MILSHLINSIIIITIAFQIDVIVESNACLIAINAPHLAHLVILNLLDLVLPTINIALVTAIAALPRQCLSLIHI